MISLNATIFIQLVNFFLLLALLNIILYKPILSMLEGRKRRVEEAEQNVESLQETVNRKRAEYEEKLARAKQEALNEKAALLKETAEEGKAQVDGQRNRIPALLAEFQSRISNETEAARATLRKQTEVLSAEIAEKVLGRRLS